MARNIEVARLFARMDLDIKNAEASTGKIGGALSGLASTITKHPVAALGTLGAAAAAAVLKLGDMAAQFEQRMAEIGTLVDKNSVDMEKLATDVLGLFASLPVESLEDLTRGLYSIVSAGVPAGDAIDVLRTAAEAAIGGVTDVNTAVDGLTTAMNAFQTQGVTAEEAADAFFVAVKAGKTTFGELSSSIGNVAGLANSLGVSLDDLLANTSALTLGGLKTSEAMNALKAVLSNIAKPTAELRREYPGLAAEFGLAALQSKGLTGFLGDLAGELSGNQQAAVKMFGSVEALNAVLSLTADGGARVARITADMEAKTGAASAAYEEMAGTTKNTEQVLKNKLEAALTKLGETVLPATNAGLEITIGLLNTLQRILDAFKGKEQPIDFGIGPAAVETLQRVLGDPRFGGTAIDLENLKAGSREYGALRGAVESLQFALQNGFTKALGVTDDALVQMRATVEAYAKAHVRSLVDAGQSADVLAQHYLDMLATIDKEIAKRKNTPQPPPGLRTVDEKAAKEAVDALAKIREAELESQLALVSTQHAEYLRLTEELNRALEKLRGDDRRAAEEAIKRTTDNLLLKWAGFVGQIKTLPARLPVTERRELESTAEGVELLKLETKDFTEILKEHGLALDEDDEKKLRAKARAKELREQIKDLADEFGESNDAI
ncbi:MAG: phage tail tape measure protein, partial [Gemmatimonadales bacterium]